MRIIIRENLYDFKDDYLDYDEDKYYLVNSFKDFKKYGHKGKHHQEIEAITSNYKELLKDLEKNNIFINDQFKNMKEIELDKENNYFILQHKFINNIVEQLGYKPNPDRTYKDNKVMFNDNYISYAEFENIINDKTNVLFWISQCRFKDVELIINRGKINPDVFDIKMIDGSFISGSFLRGFIKDVYIKGGNNINASKIDNSNINKTRINFSIIYNCEINYSTLIPDNNYTIIEKTDIKDSVLILSRRYLNILFEDTTFSNIKFKFSEKDNNSFTYEDILNINNIQDIDDYIESPIYKIYDLLIKNDRKSIQLGNNKITKSQLEKIINRIKKKINF